MTYRPRRHQNDPEPVRPIVMRQSLCGFDFRINGHSLLEEGMGEIGFQGINESTQVQNYGFKRKQMSEGSST